MTTPFQGTSVKLFQPTSITGCQLWLDATDPNGNGTLPVNGSSLSTWVDKSGSGRNASLISGSPTYSNSNIAFNPATLDLFQTSAFITITQYSTAVFMVANLSPSASAATIYDMFAFPDIAFGAYTGANSIRYVNNVLNGVANNGDQYDIGNNNYYINGTFNTAIANYTTRHMLNCIVQNGGGSTRINISDSKFSRYFYGNINEVILYNSITTSQRQQIEGYLAWKWNLQTSLPATHPYRNAPIYTNPPFPLVPFVKATTNSAVFNPTNITGCSLWLDAADPNGNGNIPSNGVSISTWVDKSGNGRNAVNQATAAIFTANIQNSIAILRFNGLQNYLVTYPSFPNTAYTIFTLQFLSNNNGSYRRVIHGSPTGDGFMFVGVLTSNIATFTGNGVGWNDVTANSPNISNLNAWRIVTTWVSGSTLTPYVDGSAQTNKTGTTGAFSDISIGLWPTGSGQSWVGDLAEILIYNTALTTSQRQQVEGYLAWKWGLTANLPNGHPYKTPPIAPFSYQLRRAVQTATWSPLNIQGCILWLDPTDLSTFTFSGSNITQWRDKSTTAAVFTGTNNPVLSTTSYGGKLPISFNGSSYLQNTNFVYTTSSRSAFFVYDETVEQNNVGILSFASSGTDYNQLNTMAYETGFKSSSQYLSLVQGFGAGGYGVVIQNSTIGFALYSDTFGSTVETAYVNGSQTATITSAASFTNSTGLIIGARMLTGSIGNLLIGVIGEIILFNRPLTTSQRQQVEGYLAWKWRLQGNLPGNHPYKLWPPAP